MNKHFAMFMANKGENMSIPTVKFLVGGTADKRQAWIDSVLNSSQQETGVEWTVLKRDAFYYENDGTARDPITAKSAWEGNIMLAALEGKNIVVDANNLSAKERKQVLDTLADFGRDPETGERVLYEREALLIGLHIDDKKLTDALYAEGCDPIKQALTGKGAQESIPRVLETTSAAR